MIGIKKDIYAIYGLFRHEMIFELKSGLFLGAIILPIIVTIVLGFAIGFQGIPPKNVEVGLFQEPGIVPLDEPILKSNENVKISKYESIQSLEESIDADKTIVGVIIEKSGTNNITIKIVQDDTKVTIARSAIADINKQFLNYNEVSTTGSSLSINSRYGLDVNNENYLLQILSPGFIVMASIYIAIIFSGFVIAQERENNTIYELALAPVPNYVIILGKLISGIITLVIETTLIFLLVDLFIIESKGSGIEIITVAVLCGIGITGILYIATSFVKDFQKLRVMLGIPVFMPLIFFSGVFYPLESFPELLQNIAELIPTSWANDIIKGIFFKGKSIIDYPIRFLNLVFFSLTAILLGSFFLKRTLRQN